MTDTDETDEGYSTEEAVEVFIKNTTRALALAASIGTPSVDEYQLGDHKNPGTDKYVRVTVEQITKEQFEAEDVT
jgi:hypothetical protein